MMLYLFNNDDLLSKKSIAVAKVCGSSELGVSEFNQ
jgi:hypothetical protein